MIPTPQARLAAAKKKRLPLATSPAAPRPHHHEITTMLQAHSDPRLWDGPTSREAQPAWLKNIQAERETVLRKINYTGGVFDVSLSPA